MNPKPPPPPRPEVTFEMKRVDGKDDKEKKLEKKEEGKKVEKKDEAKKMEKVKSGLLTTMKTKYIEPEKQSK